MSLRRASLLEKIDIFLVVATPKLAAQYRSLQKAFKEVLDIRNRLAHFKDSDAPLPDHLNSLQDASTLKENIHFLFEDADDPELIRELKAPLVLIHARTLSTMGQWLVGLERAHAKSHGITTTYERGRRPRTTR